MLPTTPPAMAPALLEFFRPGAEVGEPVDEVEVKLASARDEEDEPDEELPEMTWPFIMNTPCPALQQFVAVTPQQKLPSVH
jgi:hypothetical protein